MTTLSPINSTTTAVELTNVRKTFGTVPAVNDVSLRVQEGEILGLLGPSGCGKTTLLRLIAGLDTPDGGTIAIGDRPVSATNLFVPPEQRSLGMVFQDFALFPHLTVAENIAFGLQQRLTKKQIQERVAAVLALVHLQGLEKRYPHELSGGQLQRVMIAMAISCDPALLIADEPTTALDVTVQATILDLLRELRDRRQMSMMFITHDLGIIAEIADSVAVMYRGKIVEYGSVEQIFTHPQHPYTKGLLACRPSLERRSQYLLTVSDFMSVGLTRAGEVEIQAKEPTYPPQVSDEALMQRLRNLQQQSPLLQVRNLQVGFPIRNAFGQTKRYFLAVNGVSFEVYPGETLGLVGESGCGKTTLGRTLLRLVEPIGGQVFFEGRDVTNLKGRPLQQLRREMQIIFQNPFSSLDPRMKIGDAVMEPLVIHAAGQSPRQRRDRAAYLLERVGIDPKQMNRYPHQFSGGQRQRICIARALALNPKFIICDESVSSLDVSVQAQVLNLLKELQAEFNLTYIFISHDLSVVKFMSDRILVMNRGQIVEQGAAEEIYRDPKEEYTRSLIASIPTGRHNRIALRPTLNRVIGNG